MKLCSGSHHFGLSELDSDEIEMVEHRIDTGNSLPVRQHHVLSPCAVTKDQCVHNMLEYCICNTRWNV